MKRTYTLAIVLLLTFFCSFSSLKAQLSTYMADTLNKTLAKYQTLFKMKGVACSVAFPDGTVWSSAEGHYGNTPLHTDLLYDVGSNTKSMVAAVILLLEEENKLSIEDSLYKYISPVNHVASGITLKQLMNHRSGIYSYTEHPDFYKAVEDTPSKFWSPDSILSHFMSSPYFQPNKSFRYSNTNYLLLGKVIESIENKPLHVVMRQRLFAPKGLTDLYMDTYETYSKSRLGVWLSNGNYHATNYISFMSSAWAAGGIIATPEQFAQWGYHLFRGDVLNATSMQKMTIGTKLTSGATYGLGVFKKNYKGKEYLYHGGTTLQNSELDYSVDSDFCITTMNIDLNFTNKTRTLHQRMIDVIEAQLPALISSVDEKKVEANKVDVFPNPATEQVTIRVVNGKQQHRVEVYSMSGQQVMHKQFTGDQTTIYSTDLKKGMYLGYVYSNGQLVSCEKIMFN